MTLTHHTYHTYAAVMNKAAWESLPDDLQTVMQEAFDVSRDYARELTLEDEKEIYERIKDQIEIIELTDEGREAFIEKSQPLYKQFEKQLTPELIAKAQAAAKGEN